MRLPRTRRRRREWPSPRSPLVWSGRSAAIDMHALVGVRDGAVTRVTLNRPDKANALSAPLVEALIEAVGRAWTDGTRLLIINGAGPHFCAGFDFTDYESASEGDLVLRFIRIETCCRRFITRRFRHSRSRTAVFSARVPIWLRAAACALQVGDGRFSCRDCGLASSWARSVSQPVSARKGRTKSLPHRVLLTPRKRCTWVPHADCGKGSLGRYRRLGTHTKRAPVAGCGRSVASAVVNDTRAGDMAALALSVSTPGIKERIREFREAQKR